MTARPTGPLNSPRIDLLPLLDMNRLSDGDAGVNFIGGYTRFYVESNLFQADAPPDATTGAVVQPRYYAREDRGFFRRWLIGRSLSRVVSMRVSLSQPNISATTTLASASHSSNRSTGETWSTEIHGRRMLTPYFRVDATTTATIEANLNASSSIQGDVTATFIDVLSRASALLAPSSTLVTSLTEERLQSASDFVDDSISALFAQTLSEKTAAEFGPGDWNTGAINVTAWLPDKDGVANDNHLNRIGDWSISLAPPIVSIFNNTPLCANKNCSGAEREAHAKVAFNDLAPYTVLNFHLDAHLTLMQAIRADEAVARALDTLARVPEGATNDVSRKAAARTLCNLVAGKAEALGFNRFDSAATVWAVGHSDLVSDAGAVDMMAADTCESARLLRRLELPLRNALRADAPAASPTVPPRSPSGVAAAGAASTSQPVGDKTGVSPDGKPAASSGPTVVAPPATPVTGTTIPAPVPALPPVPGAVQPAVGSECASTTPETTGPGI